MSNEDYYLLGVSGAIEDVLESLCPEMDNESRGDIAFEITAHLDKNHMLTGGYRRGSY